LMAVFMKMWNSQLSLNYLLNYFQVRRVLDAPCILM